MVTVEGGGSVVVGSRGVCKVNEERRRTKRHLIGPCSIKAAIKYSQIDYRCCGKWRQVDHILVIGADGTTVPGSHVLVPLARYLRALLRVANHVALIALARSACVRRPFLFVLIHFAFKYARIWVCKAWENS